MLGMVLAGCVFFARAKTAVYAEEIVSDEAWPDDTVVPEGEDPAAEHVQTEAASAAPGDIAGLFTDTGKEAVSREGETLDEARAREDPLYGYGDGGSTVNIGHLYEINGVRVRNSDFSSAHYECWTYANNMYAKIWGHNFSNQFSDYENMLRDLPDTELTLTPEHLKAYVSAAPAGAVLRVCDAQYLHADDGWGHSQVIISHDENGFTVFEGGLAAFPHRREAYFTWTGFCYSGWPGKYHYIKYIKWPGAFSWVPGEQGENAADLGVVEEETEPADSSDVEEALLELFDMVADIVRGRADPEDLELLKEAAASVREEM